MLKKRFWKKKWYKGGRDIIKEASTGKNFIFFFSNDYVGAFRKYQRNNNTLSAEEFIDIFFSQNLFIEAFFFLAFFLCLSLSLAVFESNTSFRKQDVLSVLRKSYEWFFSSRVIYPRVSPCFSVYVVNYRCENFAANFITTCKVAWISWNLIFPSV